MIKKLILFTGIVLVATGVTAFSLVAAQLMWGSSTPLPKNIMYLFAIIATALIYRPVEKSLSDLTDRLLFGRKYDYHTLLKENSKRMTFVQSFNALARGIVAFLIRKGRIRNAAILVASSDNKHYTLRYPLGYGPKAARPNLILSETHPVVMLLQKKHAAISRDEIDNYFKQREQKDASDTADYRAVRKTLDLLQAEIFIPSFLSMAPMNGVNSPKRVTTLRTILVLGPKKSAERFTEEDINVFFTLAQESAIAIENARLYDEAVRRAKELEHINKEMNMASSRLLGALAETEEANKRLKDTQSQLVHEQKMATLGRLAASVGHEVNNPLTVLSMNISRVLLRLKKEPQLQVSEILPIFEKMEHNIQRIKAVVNTLTGLLKKSERGRFEALSVKILIEETLPLVQFQTYLDNLSGTEVEFNIPSDVSLVKGDLERLQEVFLNLFINAYQAMAGKRERRIAISARNDMETRRVRIDFEDNGCGMSDEVIKRIFNFRFTTKREGKGSGIGLYMCRYIIELHGGEISVRSKAGDGTTFTVWLPIYDEHPGRDEITFAEKRN